jgi:collagenase-like PrtC family protease
MKISVQTPSLSLLREALDSKRSAVRFGPEFCEHLLPNLGTSGRAYELACEGEKELTHVTPRLSNAGIEKLREQFPFLSEKGEASVVVNDFGALNILRHYPKLHPHLGRTYSWCLPVAHGLKDISRGKIPLPKSGGGFVTSIPPPASTIKQR